MSTWAAEDLDRIGGAEEIEMTTVRGDGRRARWWRSG
jgi:hypothetical protein